MQRLKLFLPQAESSQIFAISDLESMQSDLEINAPKKDWEQAFTGFIGNKQHSLPWTQLMVSLFQLPPAAKFACCCDPALVQMTHRGAYMLGQDSLDLQSNQAIKIVAQINDSLMEPGQQLLMADEYRWLFVSETPMELVADFPGDLVGKDLFGHQYRGNQSEYWQQLSTEIQMLVKQMADYEGIIETPADGLFHVHFYDGVDLTAPPELPFVKNQGLNVFTDNELIKNYCMRSLISQSSTSDLQLADAVSKSDVAALAFDSERECYGGLLDLWCRRVMQGAVAEASIYCRDLEIQFRRKGNWLTRWFR